MSFLDSTGVATLTSDIKTITDATYPANAAIAPPYDSTSAYAVGDFCLKDGLFYKCNTAIASGGETWTAAHWTLTDTADNLGTKMVILAYGSSTWNDFINAYNKNAIVYCRASSNSNPATGNQTRMAFMAYVNASTPTSVEFQYYRSVNSHSATQQGDQVCVYKLDKTAGWTVTVRENYTKIVAGTGLSSSYSSGTLTLNNTVTAPEAATATPLAAGTAAVGSSVKYAREDHVHPEQTTISGHTIASDVPANAGFLPSVSSADNDKVLKVVSGAWAAATDDGVPTMVANITYSSGTYTSDKTYAQLKAVLDASGIAYVYKSPNFYEVQQYDSSRIAFKRTYVDMSNYLVRDEYWYIYSSNLVSSGYANAYTQFRQYIYLVCDDDYSYQDNPSGTFSIDTNGQIDDIMTLFRSVTSDGGDSQVIIDLIYGNPNAETDGSACEVYHPLKAYIDIENGNSICTIVYHTLSSRNGLPVVKNVVIRGPIYSYEFLEDATVTYSEYTAFLPSVTSSDNDKVLKVVSGAWPASADSGGDTMVVIVTESYGDYSADKTFAQIKAAADAGTIVVAKYGTSWYPLVRCTTTSATFSRCVIGSMSVGTEDIYIASNYVEVAISPIIIPTDKVNIIVVEDNPDPSTAQYIPYIVTSNNGNINYDEVINMSNSQSGDYGISPILQYWKSRYDDSSTPATDAEMEEYQLIKAYSETTYESELDYYITDRHLVFGRVALVNNVATLQIFDASEYGIVTFSSKSLESSAVTSVNGRTGAVTVRELPSVSSSDNGKFLCVDNGVWAAVTVPSANGVSF